MSLINDALRKARQAAAEHDGRAGRARPPMAYPSRGQGRGVGTAAVAMIAVAAGIGGAAAVWWAMSGPASQPERAVAAPLATAEVGPTASAPATRSGELPLVAAGRDRADEPPAPPSPTAADAERVRPGGEAAGEPAGRERSPDEPAAAGEGRRAARSDPSSSRGPGGERVFVLDADLGDVSLSLDFIVFRQVRPFAEINGVEVSEGSEIEGFTVETIEADQVTLRNADGLLILKVR